MGNTLHSTLEKGPERGTTFLAVVLIFTALAIVFVLLRIYIRIWIRHSFGWDDGMVIVSMVSV